MFRPHVSLACTVVLGAALASLGCARLTQPDDITIVAEPPPAPAPAPAPAGAAAPMPQRGMPQASPGTG